MNGYTIRPASPADTPAILAAFGRAFPSRRNGAEWDWIYRHNPEGSEGMLCLTKDGKVAAFCGASRHRLRWRTESVLVAQTRDAFSHPAHRAIRAGRGGLFVQTAAALFETCGPASGVSFHYGFPSPRHLRLGQKLLGYEAGHNWVRYRYDVLRNSPTVSPPSGRLETVVEFGVDFDTLAQTRRSRDLLSFVHDSGFLNWRFSPRTGRKYWVWGYYPHWSGELAGYVVFSVAGGTGFLIDLHLPAGYRDHFGFWRLIVEKLRWLGIGNIDCWLSRNHPDHAALQSLGLIEQSLPEHTALCFRRYPQSPALQDLHEYFCFSMADCDLF